MPSKGDKRLLPLKNFLDNFGKSVVGEMRTRLKGFDKNKGKLSKTAKHRVVFKNGFYELSYELEDYYPFVDKGVSGTQKSVGSPFKFKYDRPSKKHVKALEKWGKFRGIPKERAYAIGVKVKREGIKPTQFYTISTTRRRKQFEKQVEQVIFDILNK